MVYAAFIIRLRNQGKVQAKKQTLAEGEPKLN